MDPKHSPGIRFDTWAEVMAHARAGKPLYYHAPLDSSYHRLRCRDGRPGDLTYSVRARTIRIWPFGSVGRGRNRTSDPFTADAGHLSRFSRVEL